MLNWLTKRVVIFHKSTSDEGALAMMCGRDEEPQSIKCSSLLKNCYELTHVIRLWTHVVDNKKQASRELKKIVDDA
jgi:hypothetical protein